MSLRLAARCCAPLLAILLLLGVGQPAAAQEDDDRTPRIGVVDLQRIMRESVAAQKVRAELEARQAQYREEIGAREDALRAQQQELERQRTILSPEAFAERELEFSKSVEALQREVAERNRQLEEALSYGMQRVNLATLKIVAGIAEELGLGLVLDKTQLLLVSKGLEFSDRALAQLNAEVVSVPTSPPAE